MSQSLLINGDLVNPPSSITCVREVTLIAHEYLDFDVIIECIAEKDFYHRYLKNFGAMDYVDDLTMFGEEEGLRIDKDFNYHPTIYVTEVINEYNVESILQTLGFRGFRNHL